MERRGASNRRPEVWERMKRTALFLPVAVLAIAAAAALVAAAGRWSGAKGPPGRQADFQGTVTSVQRPHAAPDGGPAVTPVDPDTPVSSADHPAQGSSRSEVLGVLLVEENPGAPPGAPGYSVSVTRSTAIWKAGGGVYRPAAFAEVTEGRRVALWYTGPVRESYPPQAVAEALVILE